MRKKLIVTGILAGFVMAAGLGIFVITRGEMDMYQIRRQMYARNAGLYRAIKKTIQDNDVDIVSAADPSTPALSLLLSRKDVAHFADLYSKFESPEFGVEHYMQNNKWRKADLLFDGKKYGIKIKAHGKNPSGHRVGKFISFAVKIDGGERVLGYRRFSLIIRNRIQSNRQVLRQLAEEFGVLFHDLSLVKVKINSWEEKLYYLQPPFGDAFFETEGLASFRVFKREVSPLASSHKSMLDLGNDPTPFQPSTYQSDFLALLDPEAYSAELQREIIARHRALNELLASGNEERILEFVDFEYITSFDALRTFIAASEHGFRIEANFHVAYNLANGKFYPVATDDIYWSRLQLAEGQAVEEVVDRYREHGETELLRFFNLLSKNDRIRHRKYEKIFAAISAEPEEMVRRHEGIMTEYDSLHYFGVFKQLLRKSGLSGFPVHTGNNIEVLRRYLEIAEPAVEIGVFSDGMRIELRPGSMAGVKVASIHPEGSAPKVVEEITVAEETPEGLKRRHTRSNSEGADLLEGLSDLVFADGVDDASKRMDRTYVIQVRWRADPGREDAGLEPELTLVNAVTRSPVTPVVSSWRRDGPLPALEIVADLEESELTEDLERLETLGFRVQGASVVVPRGTYTVERDLLLPAGLKLVIEAGAKILLGQDVALVSRNGLEVRGTAEEPVTITALDPTKPFGAVGILGNDTAEADIKHLHLSHGNERIVEGVYFSGALSIYHHEAVTLSDSLISDGQADDGLNIKYAPLTLIERTRFENNFADQVDLDYCNGLVVDSTFVNEFGDANGDGLDLSGSVVVVFDNQFDSFYDKGLSIGEGSRIYVFSNRFSDNNMGVAVKDSSLAYLFGNRFLGNATDLALYRKKTIWGGATARLLSLSEDRRVLSYTTDESSVVESLTLDEVSWESWYAGLAELVAATAVDPEGVTELLDSVEANLSD